MRNLDSHSTSRLISPTFSRKESIHLPAHGSATETLGGSGFVGMMIGRKLDFTLAFTCEPKEDRHPVRRYVERSFLR